MGSPPWTFLVAKVAYYSFPPEQLVRRKSFVVQAGRDSISMLDALLTLILIGAGTPESRH
jgi:hypothetical protein